MKKVIISVLFAVAAFSGYAQKSVTIVYKTHFDIGYSSTVQDVVHEYRVEMVDRVLDAIEKNSKQPKENQFVWTVSGWPMQQMLWEGQAPERKQKIEQAIRDGNLAIHGYPFTTHTEIAEIEDLVRGLNISSSLARTYGKPLSVSAKMSDVPGQSWFIPTLFTQAGIKFYHMGGPVVNREHGLPPIFWWEGPDGSRLLVLYNNGYGSSPLPPANWPFRNWVYINMTGDNAGPPDPATVNRDLAFYREKGIEARVGSMDDFAREILKEDLTSLPVVRSDIGDVWIHGPMSQPVAVKEAKNVRLEIGGLDQLNTLEGIWGIFTPDHRSRIGRAYEQSLLFSEHTWGLANQHYIKVPWGPDWNELWSQGLPPQYELMERSWKDHADYVKNVSGLINQPYEEALATLADQVAVQGPRIVVYNPLPWKRDGEVLIDSRILPAFQSLKPADGGDPVIVSPEFSAIEDKAPVTRFVARDLPAMGYRTFIACQDQLQENELLADEGLGMIESRWFRVRIDPDKGRIVSMVDKRTGRELVDPEAPQGFGSLLYERFGYKDISNWLEKSLYPQYTAHRFCFAAYDMPKDSAYRSASPEKMKLTVRKSPIDVTAVLSGTLPGPGHPQEITIRITLPAASPEANLEVSWEKQPDSWPEAAWICLPFKIDHPQFRLGKLGAIVDPVKDLNVENSNFYLHWIESGLAIFDKERLSGVGICPQESPLVSLGVPGEYRFDPRYVPEKPWVYINLYNNHWRTNFAAWVGHGERMSSKVKIWSFARYDNEASLITPSMEARVPLKIARSRSNPGTLQVAAAGIQLSRKGVLLTAFGPNPDGAGTVLRVWEQAGNGGTLEITLPSGSRFTRAIPVNLRGEKTAEPLKIVGNRISFPLGAFAPASFILD